MRQFFFQHTLSLVFYVCEPGLVSAVDRASRLAFGSLQAHSFTSCKLLVKGLTPSHG